MVLDSNERPERAGAGLEWPQRIEIGDVPIGRGAPLALIAGLNVLESESEALEVAASLCSLAALHGFPLVFKASYDKGNRTRGGAYRGPPPPGNLAPHFG